MKSKIILADFDSIFSFPSDLGEILCTTGLANIKYYFVHGFFCLFLIFVTFLIKVSIHEIFPYCNCYFGSSEYKFLKILRGLS